MTTMNEGYQERKAEFRQVNLNFANDIIKMLVEERYIRYPINIDKSANSLVVFIHGLVFDSVIYAHLYDDQVVEKEIRQYLQKICH